MSDIIHLKREPIGIHQVEGQLIPPHPNMNMKPEFPPISKLEQSTCERKSGILTKQEIISSVDRKTSKVLIKHEIFPPLKTNVPSTRSSKSQKKSDSFSDRLGIYAEQSELLKVEHRKLKTLKIENVSMNEEIDPLLETDEPSLTMVTKDKNKLHVDSFSGMLRTDAALEFVKVEYIKLDTEDNLMHDEMIPLLETKESVITGTGNENQNKIDSFSDRLRTDAASSYSCIVKEEQIKVEDLKAEDDPRDDEDIDNSEAVNTLKDDDSELMNSYTCLKTLKMENVSMNEEIDPLLETDEPSSTMVTKDKSKLESFSGMLRTNAASDFVKVEYIKLDTEDNLMHDEMIPLLETKEPVITGTGNENQNKLDSFSDRLRTDAASSYSCIVKEKLKQIEDLKAEDDPRDDEDIDNSEAVNKIKDDDSELMNPYTCNMRNYTRGIQHKIVHSGTQKDESGTEEEVESRIELYIDRDDSISWYLESGGELRQHQEKSRTLKTTLVQEKISKRYRCSVILTDIGPLIKQDGVHFALKVTSSSQGPVHDHSHRDVSRNVSPRDLETASRNKTFLCETCNKTFTQTANLQAHIRSHIGEKHLQCEDCGTRFTHIVSLRIHKRKHTGSNSKSFVCIDCGAAFIHSYHLQRHKGKHVDSKFYKCKECGSAFARKDVLEMHKSIHTKSKPFKCLECGMMFGRNDNLQRHNRIHTGETPYSCDVCGKAFVQGGDLIKHKRTHTGEKLFLCDICGKDFTRRSSLQRHEQIHIRKKNA